MSGYAEYALPLFSLIDRGKIDLNQPLPEVLGEQLGMYLKVQFRIESVSTQLILLGEEPYLVLHQVPESSLPALCSLVDVQRTQLYRYQRSDRDTITLIPLNVKI